MAVSVACEGPNISVSNCGDGFYIQGSLLGVRVNCLVDTGANKSILHPKKYFSIADSCRPQLQSLISHVRLANGDKVQTLGQAEIPLNLPGVGSVVQNFVVAETEEPLILGNDFLLQNKCLIDIARQMVCVDGKEIKCSLEHNLTSLFRLKVLETTVVPPNSEMVFPGYVHAQDNTILPRYSIIEPNDSVYTKGL